jgi:capsule polysaccharide export protein KpsE/RkpR
MKLMDRVAAGLDQLGKKAVQAIDEGKLRMDVAGVRRRKDHAARDLGYLAYRQSKGEVPAEGDTELQIRRIAAAEEEIAKLEAELVKVRGSTAPPHDDPPPPPAEAATPAS